MKRRLAMKTFVMVALICVIILVFTGCVPGDGKNTKSHPAGFFWGVWHGWLAPVSLVIGIFNKSISIYEVNNTGWWYDLGFYMAIISGFGGLSLARRKSNE